jgi:hypothetical protein
MSIRSTGISREERNLGHGSSPIKPLTVTVRVARQISGLGNTKIYELINNGAIESVKVDNRRLVVLASLERLLTPTKANG